MGPNDSDSRRASGSMRGTVVHVIESLGRGGAETALVAGLPALARLGWRVYVVALSKPLDLAPTLRNHGIPVSSGFRTLARILLRERSTRPVVHTHLFFANMAGRALAGALGLPLVTTLHCPDYGYEGGGRLDWRRKLDRGLLRIKRPTYLSVSEAVRLDYKSQLEIESSLCPNPLDPFWLGPRPNRLEARTRLGIGAEPVVFACGRLHRSKGFEVLAAAAHQLPGVRVVIAGKGPEGARLAASRVELVGALSRETVRDWIAASDVVAVPSRWESFGIFALEAMASNAAIVATCIPGLSETLGETARYVPPDDDLALASTIRGLLADAEARDSLGRAAAERARQFTDENWARISDEVYRRVRN